MAAVKNACSRIDEFGGKLKMSLSERIRDKGVENDGKPDGAMSSAPDAVHTTRAR